MALERHSRLVPLCHATHAHAAVPKITDGLKSADPNERPTTVREAAPKVGTFSIEYDATAPSKVKMPSMEPVNAPMVRSEEPNVDRTDELLHKADVADVQEADEHVANASPDEAVKSTFPKERPVTVTSAPPLSGLFKRAAETIVLSKENARVFVPTVFPTVTAPVNNATATASGVHLTLELLVQALVSHTADATAAEPVTSKGPKLRPLTVKEVLPEVAKFSRAYDTTGASKLTVENAVPATAATVTCVSAAMSAMLAETLTTEVVEVQETVKEVASSKTEDAVMSSDPKFSPSNVNEDLPVRAELSKP